MYLSVSLMSYGRWPRLIIELVGSRVANFWLLPFLFDLDIVQGSVLTNFLISNLLKFTFISFDLKTWTLPGNCLFNQVISHLLKSRSL